MVKRLSALWIAFALLFTLQAHAADFTASVDRKQISEGDTFTLSLRYGEQVGFGSPDLKPLQQDFQILNQQRANQYRSINGQTESYTEWTLTMAAKRTGQLTIPAIKFDGESTQPITLTVSQLSDDVKAQQQKQFFFDISITQQDNYYVQGEILYTEKLYYSVNHDDATLSPFKVTDARVQQLGDIRQYTTVIDGVRFGVYERRFAIFPEVSGDLVIPGQRFSATVSNPYDRWSRGRQAAAVSKPIHLNVLPIPAGYPTAPWLPTDSLQIDEKFSEDPSRWKAGEPVTRTITLTADGLPGSQLPTVTLPVIDKVRYYPDQTKQDDQVTDNGITGVSEQSIAIVPTSAGRLVLPEVRIPWWNTRLGKLEYAILPAHTYTVAAAANSPVKGSTPASTDSDSNTPAVKTDDSGAVLPAISLKQNPLWLILLAVSVLVNLVLIVVLLRQRRQHPVPADESAASLHSQQAWKALNDACRKGNAPAARAALLQWASHQGLSQQPLVSLSQLAAVTDDEALRHALAELDATLFSPGGNSAWNGQGLLALLKKLKPATGAGMQEGLYPQ